MSVSKLTRKREFLYVPKAEQDEALSLGAVWVTGDARLVTPRPLPMGVSDDAFERWRTAPAKYRWCLEVMRSILGGLEDPRARRSGAGSTLAELQAEAEADRVYLFVPMQDGDRARRVHGVRWDRRHKMFYAETGADLGKCFRWLTPNAQAAWSAEREATRMLDHLVRVQARKEKKRRDDAGEGEGIQSGRDQAQIK